VQKTRIPERRKAAFKAVCLNMENTLFYIFLFLIYPVLMFGTVLFCTRKREENRLTESECDECLGVGYTGTDEDGFSILCRKCEGEGTVWNEKSSHYFLKRENAK